MAEVVMDDAGQVLRALRQSARLSLRALAGKAKVSKSLIDHIESGDRRLNLTIAEALDLALGTPILAMLVRTEGDDVRRRALLAHLGILGAGAGTLSEALRLKLDEAADTAPADWDAIVADHNRRLVSDPSPAFGTALKADLELVQRRIDDGRPSKEDFRAAAGLAQVCGLYAGNQGLLPMAHHWYGSSIKLARTSRDTTLWAWVQGRSYARGIWEGFSVRQTVTGAQQVLAVSSTSPGALEAHAALVHVHALTGDVKAGRAAVAGMIRVAEELPNPAGAYERAMFLNAFLESRVGSFADAEQACDDALSVLGDWPLWEAETQVFLARARAASGDLGGGIGHALATVQELRHDVRVIGVAVADVLSVVPAGYRSDELHALRGYAHTGPLPWENVR